jgi:hypothetical protein
VAQIGQQRVDQMLPAAGADLVACGRHAADLDAGGAAGVLWREAARDEGGSGFVLIMLQFLGDLAIGVGAMGEHAHAAGKLAPEGH